MERPGRVELPTSWFEARCSVQMSYGREKLVPLSASNRRPIVYKASALSTELKGLTLECRARFELAWGVPVGFAVRCLRPLGNLHEKSLVPQVGFEPTRPKALVSETSAATYYATGASILESRDRFRQRSGGNEGNKTFARRAKADCSAVELLPPTNLPSRPGASPWLSCDVRPPFVSWPTRRRGFERPESSVLVS